MSTPEDTAGPYIVWVNNGCEGWSPRSFSTLKDALIGERYTTTFVVTKAIDFDVVEKPTP